MTIFAFIAQLAVVGIDFLVAVNALPFGITIRLVRGMAIFASDLGVAVFQREVGLIVIERVKIEQHDPGVPPLVIGVAMAAPDRLSFG